MTFLFSVTFILVWLITLSCWTSVYFGSSPLPLSPFLAILFDLALQSCARIFTGLSWLLSIYALSIQCPATLKTNSPP